MINCPTCQGQQFENTLFCAECGAYLRADKPRETNPVDMPDLAAMIATLLKPSSPAEKTASATISLKIGAGREVELIVKRSIHLGRLDPIANVLPDIDLTEDGGLEKGVSRRHARIIWHQGNIMLEDLGSANGTFINGEKISPFYTEVISDGDLLQLGDLQIEVGLPHVQPQQ